ncbi:class I adenylate-forming enzyme family protein [Roseomonas sp. CECT 9278]|uniref:class I adenylate-forming enzyme family protein n=1 Tax=Roseomonas sp. CECT 9278 TaxID=2845823 RepID=UPI001E54C6DC|nr:class I adenylate-forming enzyme family protein [Roseomonas sp. CECT 9278]
MTLAIAGWARRDPGRLAFVDRGAGVSYGALDRRIGALAAWLARQGIAPGDMVALTLRDDMAHITAALALLRLGCDQVSLASHDPPALRQAIAGRLRPALLLGDEAADALPGLAFLRLDPAAAMAGGHDAPARTGRFVLSSSGTTGRPKLVRLGEADIAAQIARRTGEGRVYYRSITVEHNNARKYHLGLLSLGATTVLSNCATLPDLAEACARFRIERVTLPPERAAALADLQARAGAHPWPAHTSLAVFGAAVAPALRRRLMAEVTPGLVVNYSTTEVGTITLAGPADHARHPDGVGRPLEGVALRIVDDAGRDLPPGVPGLVRLRAPGMAQGYLDDPPAAARAFHDGWFQPGDRGWIEPDGTLVFAGRDAEMMMLGTINIFPAEIERAAEGFPGVADCAAFALRSPALGDIPALAVVETAPGALDVAALAAACRAKLGLRAPRRVVVVGTLPRTATGKVQRDRLAALAGG